jgi:hypothetical protein
MSYGRVFALEILHAFVGFLSVGAWLVAAGPDSPTRAIHERVVSANWIVVQALQSTRRMKTQFLAVGIVAVLGGCIADPPAGDDNPTDTNLTAKELFKRDVHPFIAGKCLGCHTEGRPISAAAPGFANQDPERDYTSSTSNPQLVGDYTAANAHIITLVDANHQLTTFSPGERDKIVAWLVKETAERNPTPGGQDQDPQNPPGSQDSVTNRLLKEWSGCMTIENFRTANMVAWGDVEAENNQQCKKCHATAGYFYVASDIENPYFFTGITTNRALIGKYFAVDLSGGDAAAKVVINQKVFEDTANGAPGHLEHPRYPVQNAGMAALQTFYQLTLDKKTAGTCGTPTL